MKSFRLTWFHLKRILLNNWGLLLFTSLFPVIMIFAFLMIDESDSSLMSDQASTIINHSEYVADEVIPQLDDSYQQYVTDDAEEAFDQLDQIEVSAVYEIPAGFPYSETFIQVHSLNGDNRDPLFESEFLTVLRETMAADSYDEVNISPETTEVAEPAIESSYVSLDSDLTFVIFMLLFFMGYSTGIIAGDLAKMRKEGLLTRSVLSNTYSGQILGSVLGAYSIYNILSALFIIFLTNIVFDVPLSNIGLILSIFVTMNIFVAGLTMFLFRLFKNETLIQMLGILLIIVLVFIPMLSQTMDALSIFQYLSPYYWALETLDTGVLFPNILVISLYGIVLFTAGSFKVERLVRN